MEDKMIYPLIAIIAFMLLCFCADFRHSTSSTLREMMMEEKNRWTYLPLEAIPAKVETLKKETGLQVRLVLRWNESGYACSRIYPKLDIEDVETFLRERMKYGETIVETKTTVFYEDKGLPAPFDLRKAPSHICVSIGFGEGQDPIDFDKTMDVIKKVFDYNEETEEN